MLSVILFLRSFVIYGFAFYRKQSQSIKEEYESINHIKYTVKTVNDDYGIDLSVEIDKAIKRGEKTSVITQIKKYQEQKEKHEQRKKYYRNEER